MKELRIDPEFQSKIPPLSDYEFKQLEENILKEGRVKYPIVTWNGTIVDGHHRYKIVMAHKEMNIPFEVEEKEFADKWEAFDWMYSHQLGQRNLDAEQKSYMIGKMHEARKHVRAGGQVGNQNASKRLDQSEPIVLGDTAEQIAKELGIGRETVKRAYKFAKGIDYIREQDPTLANDILTAKKKVTRTDVMNIASTPEESKSEMIAELKKDKPRVTKTKEEREADKQLDKKISETINRMRDNVRVEVTINDLISIIQNIADAAFSSFRSIIGSHREIVDNNKETISKNITNIFNETINKMKEIV